MGTSKRFVVLDGEQNNVADALAFVDMLRVLSGEERVRFLFPKQAPYSFYLPNLNTQTFWPKGSCFFFLTMEHHSFALFFSYLYAKKEKNIHCLSFFPSATLLYCSLFFLELLLNLSAEKFPWTAILEEKYNTSNVV